MGNCLRSEDGAVLFHCLVGGDGRWRYECGIGCGTYTQETTCLFSKNNAIMHHFIL